MATVLTIDDSSLAHHVVRLALARTSHTLVEARDGIEGVEAARRVRPDLVIVGLSLPGLDGMEVAAAIHEEGAGTPIVMIGTGVSEWTHGACAEMGVVAFLERPVDATSVRREVRRALSSSSRAAA